MTEENATLLIVEDDNHAADMLKAYLLARDFQVIVANHGADALRVCRMEPIELVLLDINLPDFDGLDVAKQLRCQPECEDIPIIFLAEEKDRQFCGKDLELDAQDYIRKPYEIEEIGLRIRKALSQHPGQKITPKQTDLPQGETVDERLKKWLNEPSWALLLLRLLQMDHILNIYGYPAASEILDLVGRLLLDTLDRLKISGFAGHFSGTEFVLVVPTNSQAIIKKHLQRRLSKTLGYLTASQKEDEQRGLPPPFELYNIAHTAEIDSLAALKIKLESLQVKL